MSETAKVYIVDKTNWKNGPWMGEADKVQWRTASGLPGLIVRNARLGFLCGYAGVPPGHPMHGKGYEEVRDSVEVHGRLTYAAPCQEDGKICHVPEPGEPAEIWWFGFDCGHAWDIAPGRPEFGFDSPEIDVVYRDFDWVKSEVESLATQLAAIQ